MDDLLKLDPEVLEATAGVIERYCEGQMAIMNEYLNNTTSLGSEWTDDQTFGSLLEEVRRIKSSVEQVMAEIKGVYPQYFRGRAAYIRSRPDYRG